MNEAAARNELYFVRFVRKHAPESLTLRQKHRSSPAWLLRPAQVDASHVVQRLVAIPSSTLRVSRSYPPAGQKRHQAQEVLSLLPYAASLHTELPFRPISH